MNNRTIAIMEENRKERWYKNRKCTCNAFCPGGVPCQDYHCPIHPFDPQEAFNAGRRMERELIEEDVKGLLP